MNLKSIEWNGSFLKLLDQTKIPKHKIYIPIYNLTEVIDSIKKMIVRGAPAIAICGLYGIVMYLKSSKEKPKYKDFLEQLKFLEESRPTAVNLKLALNSFLQILPKSFYNETSLEIIQEISEKFANEYFENDIQMNQKIGEYGVTLFKPDKKELSILTHCNTGALATAGHGTALGIIRSLKQAGFNLIVYVDETRPYHQGSRLTSFELLEENINHFIIADNMAGWVMKNKSIDAVIVGADRISSNGDTANKIGTYSLSILASAHKIPFYVAATSTSFDFKLKNGNGIPIEMRAEHEITQTSVLRDDNGKVLIEEGILSPIGAKALNPSFDVTPAKKINAIVTEKGIINPVNKMNIRKVLMDLKADKEFIRRSI